MKKLFLICILFLTGCYVYIPDGVRADFAANNFLDTLYRPKKVEQIVGLGFTTIKDYLNPSKQKIFQKDDNYYHLGLKGWSIFTKKVNEILIKGRGRITGTITIEGYTVNDTKYTTAFFVDKSFRKVFATIPLNQIPASTGK